MIKKTFLLVGFCLVFNLVFSQKKLNFEFSAGPTISLFQSSEHYLFSAVKSTPNIGLFLQSNINYSASKLVSLDFGIGYSLNRFSIKEENSVRQDLVRKTSDIYFPLAINFNLGAQKSLALGVGVTTNFLLSAQEQFTLDHSNFNAIEASNEDTLFRNNSTEELENNIDNLYSNIYFGLYLQAKKTFNLSSALKGFALLKVTQNLNRFGEIEFRSDPQDSGSVTKEIEAAVVQLGFGILL